VVESNNLYYLKGIVNNKHF